MTGHVLDSSKGRKRFYVALERAGVHQITFHGLRHTFGTQMAAAGAPMRAIQEWMGHADISTTEIYSHYAPDPTGWVAFAQKALRARGGGGAQNWFGSAENAICEQARRFDFVPPNRERSAYGCVVRRWIHATPSSRVTLHAAMSSTMDASIVTSSLFQCRPLASRKRAVSRNAARLLPSGSGWFWARCAMTTAACSSSSG
nr:tyrosine-type recombinase/integrase [Baekduia sp.]